MLKKSEILNESTKDPELVGSVSTISLSTAWILDPEQAGLKS